MDSGLRLGSEGALDDDATCPPSVGSTCWVRSEILSPNVSLKRRASTPDDGVPTRHMPRTLPFGARLRHQGASAGL
jgi:hypothetical protein